MTRRWVDKAGMLVASLLVTACTIVSFVRNDIWRDPIAIWIDTIAKSGAKARPWYKLGREYIRLGNLDLAGVNMGRARELDPAFFRSKMPTAEDYQQMGMLDDAAVVYREELQERPGDAVLHNRYGCVLYGLGLHDDAAAEFDAALAIDPVYAEAYANRGVIAIDRGAFDAGLRDLRRAVELWPDQAEFQVRLAIGLERSGQVDEARKTYRAVLKLDPQNPDARWALGLPAQEVDRSLQRRPAGLPRP